MYLFTYVYQGTMTLSTVSNIFFTARLGGRSGITSIETVGVLPVVGMQILAGMKGSVG